MGHWGPKSTSSLFFCSISSVPLRGPLCYLPLLSLPHQTQIAPNFLTPSRLQTGSLYMPATSQTPPLSPHSSQASSTHGSDILRSLLSPPTSQAWGRIAHPCSPLAWLVAALYCVLPLGHRQLSPSFFYCSGHVFGLFCPLSLAQSKKTPSWGL